MNFVIILFLAVYEYLHPLIIAKRKNPKSFLKNLIYNHLAIYQWQKLKPFVIKTSKKLKMYKNYQNSYLAIGLMSGTSMDGIDLALIESDGSSIIRSLASKYIAFDDDLLMKIRNLIGNKLHHLADIKIAEKEFTLANAKMVNDFLIENQISAQDIDFIGFHGQTIYHDAKKFLTWQIGNSFLLAKETNIRVVGDFRNKDLAYYGKGAPLVPIYHFTLFGKMFDNAIIINIGGVSNITYYTNRNIDSLWASDICFGNALFDDIMLKELQQKYDAEGAITNRGNADEKLAISILQEEAFQYDLPFSFDRNDFYMIIDKLQHLAIEDKLATLAMIYAKQLFKIIKKYQLNTDKIILCGGGRKNLGIVKHLKREADIYNQNNQKCNPAERINVINCEDIGINGDIIEAEAFAFLAIRSFLNLPISFYHTTATSKINGCEGGVIYNK